ncbi:MAG: InlB B-repeat-containing protein, partial [Eubacterium sp.]
MTDESGKKKSIFKNCYSASMVGMIGGGTTMGGFAGYAAARTVFENCYATGEVGSLDTDTQKFTSVGGFSGTIMGTYTNCIYDKQTTAMKNIGGGTAAGVTGKSTKAITGHVAEGDVAGKIISDGFATEENDPWVAEAGLYPQIKAFSDPAASGFPVDQVDLVKAYSLASASTVFLRDESSAEMPNNYDTVRDILELFSFTSVAKNGNYGFKWEVDPKHYDVGEKDIYSPIVTDKKTPVLSFDAKNIGIDDQITNMAPGIGWTRVTAMFTGIDGKLVTGNRALRIVPTAAISLGVANPDMGIGRDVRIFPDVDVNKTYNHREGVKLIRTTAEDLNKVPPKAPHGLYPDETYKNAVVMLAIDPESDDPELSTPENRGTIDVIIKKYDHTKPISQESLLSADVVPNDEAFMTDEQKAANARYRELFNGAKDFTKDDYGIYVLTYKWTVDGVVQTNSKKVYILPATALSYRYNDGDENTGSTESPLDDCYITGYHRANEKAGIEDNYEGQTFKLADGPTRSGYRFVGWSLDAAATPESYTANTDGKAFIVGSQLKEDTVVYAVWEIRNYDVCFKADGLDSFGMNTDTTVTGIGYGDSISATPGKAFPEVPTAGAVDHNTNKKFLGWSTMNPLDLPKDKDGKAIAQTVDFGADSSISIVGLGYSDYYKYFVDEKEANTVITVYPVIKTNEATLRFYNNDGSTINDKKGAQVGADYKILYGGTYPAAPVV